MSLIPKILLILPYFGKLPQYWGGYIKSCEDNENIDFLIVGDYINEDIPVAKNIRYVHMTWKKMQRLVKDTLSGFGYNRVCISHPYKLCDYKPTYGVLFKDYVDGYDYWGYMDCDLLFGNLEKFIKNINISLYDRVWPAGHLSLYKNCKEVNTLFTRTFDGIELFRDVCSNTLIHNFDELAINKYFIAAGLRFFDSSYDATFGIYCKEYKWINAKNPELGEVFVKSEDGSTVVYIELPEGNIERREVSYIHFMTKKNIVISYEQERPYYISHNGIGLFQPEKLYDILAQTRTDKETDRIFAKHQILLFRRASIKKVFREVRYNHYHSLIPLLRKIPTYLKYHKLYRSKTRKY